MLGHIASFAQFFKSTSLQYLFLMTHVGLETGAGQVRAGQGRAGQGRAGQGTRQKQS